MTNAVSTALAIPELLEQILLHLPPHDVVLSQRVARLWQKTVEQSSGIQQKLFRKPILTSEEWTALIDCHQDNTERLFLVQAIPHEELEPTTDPYLSYSYRGFAVLEPNPLIKLVPELYKPVEDFRRTDKYTRWARGVSYGVLYSGCWDQAIVERPIYINSTPPVLLSMFLTQPPARHVLVDFEDETGLIFCERVDNANGVTFGNVVDTIKLEIPNESLATGVRIYFPRCLVSAENLRCVIEEGVKKFEDLESKVGRASALRIVGRSRTHSGKDISLLLARGKLHKILTMGKLNAVADGEPIADILAELEKMKV